jgi:hypothetical protein
MAPFACRSAVPRVDFLCPSILGNDKKVDMRIFFVTMKNNTLERRPEDIV